MDLSPETLRRAQSSDTAAQASFVRAAMGPVRALLRRLSASTPGDVDDHAQDALTHLLRVLPQFDARGPAQLGTWIHTVVYRWWLMQKRKRHLQLVPMEEAAAVADSNPDAQQLVERQQLRAQLDDAIAKLSETHRRVFVMAQLHQLSLQEIADAEGISLGTVKSRLHRAKAELVMLLGDLLDEDGSGNGNGNGGAHAANG